MNFLVSTATKSKIRTQDHDGRTWFCLTDVLSTIGTSTTTNRAITSLNKAFGAAPVANLPATDSLGRLQTTTFITEQALYWLVFHSNNAIPLAVSFLSEIEDQKKILKALNEFEVPENLPDMYVYAIRETDTGNVKLGISADPQKRLQQLQTGNSSTLELVAFRKAENRFHDETLLHESASQYHLHHEWFSGDALEVLQ